MGDDGGIRTVVMNDTKFAQDAITTPKISTEQGLRYNEGKIRYDLVPVDALEALADVFTAGAAKYAPRNWEKGMPWMSVYASLFRHLMKWCMGENRDKDSGQLHMAHVTWNAMAILTYQLRQIGDDDRVKLQGN